MWKKLAGGVAVHRVMTPYPNVLTGSIALVDVARVMRRAQVGAVLLQDNDGKLAILTDRDLVVRALAVGLEALESWAIEFASRRLVSLQPDDTIHRALHLMTWHAIRRLPVLENGRPVGIVSLGDLARVHDVSDVYGTICAAPPSP